MGSYDRENRNELTWADQWDYRFDHSISSDGRGNGKDGSKLAEYNKKAKAAARTGLDKAKIAATIGAKKVKSGTVSGARWLKDQYQKRRQK